MIGFRMSVNALKRAVAENEYSILRFNINQENDVIKLFGKGTAHADILWNISFFLRHLHIKKIYSKSEINSLQVHNNEK